MIEDNSRNQLLVLYLVLVVVSQTRLPNLEKERLYFAYMTHMRMGVGIGGGQGGVMPPQNLGGLGPLGLVFFTLENVLYLLFESAIPGGKKHNIDHIL